MGQQLCCIQQEEKLTKGNQNNRKRDDLINRQSEKKNKQNFVDSQNFKNSLNQDSDIPVYERISEIETKEVQASAKKKHQYSGKKSIGQNNIAHYSSESNIVENQYDSQENSKNQIGEDVNNPAILGITPKNNRREIYEGQNFKTFSQERNLDLSNTNNTNNLANTYNNYTQQNQLSQSNISDRSVNQNYNLIKQKSQYSVRMEEFYLRKIQSKEFNHHYFNLNSSNSNNKKRNQKILTEAQLKTLHSRIENELKIAIKQIQCDEENGGVFFAYDSSNIQYIKMLIIGALNTPFAFGVYVFDMYIPDDYPANPPRVNFQSTSKGTVRFSPLLPTDGRVILSILGIQNGQQQIASEQWNEKNSNIFQVIQTIQSEILNSELYFQEPGTADYKRNTNNESSFNVSDMYNLGYSNVIKYANMVYAIEEAIKLSESTYKEFSKPINTHFFLLQNEILCEINKWITNQENLKEDDIKPLYTGIVQQHNQSIVKQLQENGFSKIAKNQIKNIIQQFKKLNSQYKDSKSSIPN